MNKSYLQRKQASVLKGNSAAGSTAAKVAALSQQKGVATLFQKIVMPNIASSHEAKSLKGKVSIGKIQNPSEETN